MIPRGSYKQHNPFHKSQSKNTRCIDGSMTMLLIFSGTHGITGIKPMDGLSNRELSVFHPLRDMSQNNKHVTRNHDTVVTLNRQEDPFVNAPLAGDAGKQGAPHSVVLGLLSQRLTRQRHVSLLTLMLQTTSLCMYRVYTCHNTGCDILGDFVCTVY